MCHEYYKQFNDIEPNLLYDEPLPYDKDKKIYINESGQYTSDYSSVPHGDKPSVTFMVRYWGGPRDIWYTETVDSNGKSYGLKNKDGSDADPMYDFFASL